MNAQNETPSDLQNGLAALRTQLLQNDLTTEEITRLEHQTSALSEMLLAEKSAVEVQKLRTEIDDLMRLRRSEQLRFWIPILAPLLGALAIVATLLFQVHQFNENSRLSREATEGTQFREAMKSANLPSNLSAYTNQAILTSFLRSPAYGAQARGVVVSMLSGIQSPEGFRNLFYAVFSTVKFKDLLDLLRLARMQNEIVDKAIDAQTRAEKELASATAAAKKSGRNAPDGLSSFQQNVDRYNDEIESFKITSGITANAIAAALRDAPSTNSPDLSNTLLWQAGFSNINFNSATMTNTKLENADVTLADFSRVVDFNDSNWTYTQWWRAKALSPALLSYLEKEYGFDPAIVYRGSAASKTEVDQNIARLKSNE
jgi:uncharacterized protein YjbI with pentapeptide repeats